MTLFDIFIVISCRSFPCTVVVEDTICAMFITTAVSFGFGFVFIFKAIASVPHNISLAKRA